jgi:N-acyl-L-homoserine lactone synthetase
VPASWERGRFLSTQSAVQHASAAAASGLASQLLHSASQASPLEGVTTVATLTLTLAVAVPLLMAAVSSRLPAPARERPP